jgi:uncharacterized protein YecT (DUF1311 family)
MNTTTRTSHRKPSRTAAIQPKSILSEAAQKTFDAALNKAYDQGVSDCENGTRDHPPYGFSDLQQAWRLGWLAAKQRKDGLGSTAQQGLKRTGAR